MQRFEDYNLLGSRRPRLSPSGTATLAETMVSSALDGMRDDAAALPPTQQPQPKPTRTASGPVERRPAVSVTHGGSAHLAGSDLGWALRTLRDAPESEIRAAREHNPQEWARAMTNLDRITAQLLAELC
jgi:hypothetical protein